MKDDGAIHPTVAMEYRGELVDIDIKLADLIAEIWRLGLDTVSSCQRGTDGRAWVEFDSPEHAGIFLAYAASEFTTDLEGLWNRIVSESEPDEGWQQFRRKRMWSYGATPVDFSIERSGGELRRYRDAAFDFWILVAFPPTDIPQLVHLLRAVSR